MKHDFVTGITQKGRSRNAVVQDAPLAFLSQVNFLQSAHPCHQPHQRLRTMRIKVVHHKMPFAHIRLSRNRSLYMRGEVSFSARGSTRGVANSPTCHVQVDDERACAMPNVLELPTFHFARLHWQGGVLSLQSLYSSHLVSAQHSLSLP